MGLIKVLGDSKSAAQRPVPSTPCPPRRRRREQPRPPPCTRSTVSRGVPNFVGLACRHAAPRSPAATTRRRRGTRATRLAAGQTRGPVAGGWRVGPTVLTRPPRRGQKSARAVGTGNLLEARHRKYLRPRGPSGPSVPASSVADGPYRAAARGQNRDSVTAGRGARWALETSCTKLLACC